MAQQHEWMFSTENLVNKRVLITGGSTGIGLETARMLGHLGARLFLIARDKANLQEAVKTIQSVNKDAEVHILSMDITKPADITKLFSQIDKKWDGLDILISNAALGYGSVLDGDFKDVDYLLKTNITGYLACCKEAIPRMQKQKAGYILLIGSMSADTKDENSSLYVATKSAIQGFAEAFRKEVNEFNIHVSLIEPGAVDTPMQEIPKREKAQKIKNQEMLLSQDIAKAVYYVLTQSPGCSVVELKVRPLKQFI